MIPFSIYIGWDSREAVAWQVLAHSILKRASRPVALIPLVQSQLRALGLYQREWDPLESTEFSLTRFLVPHLSNYQGLSLFMDCDMLCLEDIATAVPQAQELPVWVVKHEYTPNPSPKMDGKQQTAYPCKNWSSFMVFNNALCKGLTPEVVNSATPAFLHRFGWAPLDRVGELHPSWNYLVGEENQSQEPPKIIHFTRGGPWLIPYREVEHAELWFDEESRMLGEA